MKLRALLPLVVAIGLLPACKQAPPPKPPKEEPKVTPIVDPLGPRPKLGTPATYKAPAAEVYRTAEGMTVWLVPRPALPMVSLTLALPAGSAEDPPGKAGLAFMTGNMVDEGAGKRDALGISSAIEALGASLSVDTMQDGSEVSLTVLKKHLPKAFEIFADVIARPKMDAKEFKRVKDLWLAQLRRRDDNPQAVAQVVSRAVLYGESTAYGHPTSGQPDTAEAVTLEDVKAFYGKQWRPDRAVLVAAGDITRQELDALIGEKLSDWKKPAAPPPPRTEPAPPLKDRPKLVLVDRPDAPQAVIAVTAPGVSASDANAPLLDLVNTALGGSFTSRINQNLREDHGWTYGARSAFVESRGHGPFVAQAAVFVDVTAPALREMLAEITKMRTGGLTADEHVKVRAHDLTDLIQTNETLNHMVSRLATLALLELPPDHDATASKARQAASMETLKALSDRYLDPANASIVVVGPRAALEPQLRTLDLGEPHIWTPRGRPAKP